MGDKTDRGALKSGLGEIRRLEKPGGDRVAHPDEVHSRRASQRKGADGEALGHDAAESFLMVLDS